MHLVSLVASLQLYQIITMFFRQVKNYLVFFIIFGLWSATWPNSKNELLMKAYSLFSIVIVFCCFLSAYILNTFQTFNSVSNTVSNLLYVSVLFAHLIIIIESICQRDAQAKIIQSLSLTDYLFNIKLKVMMPYNRGKFEIFTRCFVLVSIMILTNTTFVSYMRYKNIDYSFIYVSLYPCLVMCLRSIQIIFLVCLLRSRLILIIEELVDIQNTLNTVQTDDMKRIFFVEQNKSNAVISNNAFSGSSSINERIMHLKKIYGELYESCEQIKEAFGCSLMVITTQAFVVFTSNFYWGYMYMHDFEDLLIYILMPEVLLMGILAFYCSSCFQYVSNSFNQVKKILF